jgi:non-specific serine/threonine protein kinase/serine/threonine-protein kinase
VKVIKPGMDSRRVIARFEAERQTLALLDHPNIAHVYDAGTTDQGRPYFVMEHVEGLPITAYCDRCRLRIEDRLRLFQDVCQGVQHAHQKGIIHRDLKPSNIIVAGEEGHPIPKIIDFGVAKAMSQPLTERTLLTEDRHLLGTPAYMSPEQADLTHEDIDTRSDIYSLGVLLYVLLTGVLPFDPETLRRGGLEQVRRTIRETDPKTPSTRLRKLGQEAQAVAASRRTGVAALARRLGRELEWIPLKAMRKERAERYRSSSELADDLENYLKGAPLLAGPPGLGYKLRKLVRRHRAPVAGVATIALSLAAGIVVSMVFTLKVERARRETQLVADFLENDVLAMASRARVGEATVGYVLDLASKSLDEGKFQDRQLLEASICEKLAWTYRHIGEPEKAEQHFWRAMGLYRQHLGEEHPDTLRATEDIGWVYEDQGRYRDMERLWTRTYQIRQCRSDVRGQLSTMNALGVALYYVGKYSEAEALFEKALQSIRTELRGEEVWLHPWFRCNLAQVYTGQGRYAEAERLFAETLWTAEWPEPHSSAQFLYMSKLANTYRLQGRHAEAERLFNEALEAIRLLRGPRHVRTLRCMDGLDRLYMDQGRLHEAEDLLTGALKTAQDRLCEEHPVALGFRNGLAVLRTRQRQYDEAESLFDEVGKGRQRELGEDHPDTLQTLNDFGVLRREQGQSAAAESLLHRAWEGRQHKLGPDHPACFESLHELGVLYLRQSRGEDAEPLLLEAFQGREAKLGPEHPQTVESLKQLVTLYESWPRPEEAARWRARLGRESDGE